MFLVYIHVVHYGKEAVIIGILFLSTLKPKIVVSKYHFTLKRLGPIGEMADPKSGTGNVQNKLELYYYAIKQERLQKLC